MTNLFVEHLDQVKDPVVIDRSDNDATSDKKSIQVTQISSVEVDQVCPDISSFVFTPRNCPLRYHQPLFKRKRLSVNLRVIELP